MGCYEASQETSPDPTATRAAERLAALIRIPTVATPGAAPLAPEVAELFARMRALLDRVLPPHVLPAADRRGGARGLMLRLKGGGEERPVVLMAHQDVVPVPEDWQAEGWEHPPFDGVIADGFVHGRGALDDKGALVVMLEAVEALLEEGWKPPRDLYLLMGADEEAYGDCAVVATELLASRGVEPYLVLDEGGAVATEAFPTVKRELAVVGVSEKGILTLEISADGGGGHASTPPKRSAAGLIAAAICEIEEHPFPASVNDVTVEMFETVAPHASRAMRGLLRRAGSLRPVLARVLPRLGPEMAAMVRTTTAVTMLEGSTSHNVLATRARAVLNMRVAVGSTVDEAIAGLTDVIDDKRITVTVLERTEPSPDISLQGRSPLAGPARGRGGFIPRCGDGAVRHARGLGLSAPGPNRACRVPICAAQDVVAAARSRARTQREGRGRIPRSRHGVLSRVAHGAVGARRVGCPRTTGKEKRMTAQPDRSPSSVDDAASPCAPTSRMDRRRGLPAGRERAVRALDREQIVPARFAARATTDPVALLTRLFSLGDTLTRARASGRCRGSVRAPGVRAGGRRRSRG